MRLHQRPNHTLVRRAYDDVADQYAQLYTGSGPLPHFYQTRLRLLSALLAPMPGALALDAGSGPGMAAESLRSLGYRCVAVDASPGMAHACHARGGNASSARIESLPFPAATFDLVLALGVLEYVPDLSAALAECRRVLRPDGVVLVSLLNRTSPFRRMIQWSQRLGWIDDPVPPALFSLRTARAALSQAGFAVERVRYFDMELLPYRFGQEHPRLWGAMIRWMEPLADSLVGWLGSAMLIRPTKR